MEWLKPYNIILASQSPRRQDLMRQAGFQFEVRVADIDEENYPPAMEITAVPGFLAREKALKIFNLEPAQHRLVVIAADSLVFLDGRLFSKPLDRQEAEWMLRTLAGKTHLVITGMCILSESFCETRSVETWVEFNPITEEEIHYYINHFPPYDKAGAYGIQDWIGLCAVKGIRGSYTNIMGLPMETLYAVLKEKIKP